MALGDFLSGDWTAQNVEPEAITVIGNYAFVTLQGNNGVAKVNLLTNAIEQVFGLGSVDFTEQWLDLTDRDGGFRPEFGQDDTALRLPDGIGSFTVGGTTYFVTGNEGDARADPREEIPGYDEGDIDEDETRDGERLKTIDDDVTPVNTAFATCSFSIFDATGTDVTGSFEGCDRFCSAGFFSGGSGASFLDRNGRGTNGTLCPFVPDSQPDTNSKGRPDAEDLSDFTNANGRFTDIHGRWVALGTGSTIADWDMDTLRAEAHHAGGLSLVRLEDVHTDPTNGQQVVFATTGSNPRPGETLEGSGPNGVFVIDGTRAMAAAMPMAMCSRWISPLPSHPRA